MRLSKQFLRVLVLLMTFVMLCPTGALAQVNSPSPGEVNRLVAYQENLTLSVYAEGRQVTVNGKTTPDTQVSLVVARSLDGEKCYLDQTSSNQAGLYQFALDMDSGDYRVNVTSNGIYQQKNLRVNDARQATVSVRVEGLSQTLLPQKSIEIFDGETTVMEAVKKALDGNAVPYEIANNMINWIGKDQEKDWQWLINGTSGMALPTTPLKQSDQIVMVSGKLWNPSLTRLSVEGKNEDISVKSGTEFKVTLENYSGGGYLPTEDQPVTFAGSTKYTNDKGQVTFQADEKGVYGITAQTEGNFIRPVPLTVVVSTTGLDPYPVEDSDTFQVRMRIEGYRGTVFDGNISFKPETYKNKTTGKYEITDPDGKKYSFNYPTVLMATIAAWNKKSIRDNKVTFNDNYVARMAGEEEFDFKAQHPTCGWLVRVNDRLINQGVGVWEIEDGDTVEWFYGDIKSSFGYLDLSSSSLNTGDKLLVKVTAKGNGGVDGGDSTTRTTVSGATVHVGSETYITDAKGEAEITMNRSGSFTVYADKTDSGSSYKGYNFPLMARTEKATVTVKGPEVSIPIEEVIPVIDYTDYNQTILATLETVTPEQLAAARLPENTPAVNPENTEPTVLKTMDGVQLTIPPGALRLWSGPVQFSVEVGQVTVPPQAELGAMVLDPIKYQREFSLVDQAQDRVEFASPVTLTFPINPEDLPEGVSTRQLAFYLWNSAKGDWVKQGGVYDSSAKTLSLTTYHFSTYAVMADTAPTPKRIAGQERYDTANQASAYGWKAGADHVILANAYAYSDVLAAVPLAYKNQAPILLTEAAVLTPSTFEQLKKLNPKKVTLIGGTSVISQVIQDQLNQLYGAENVIRCGGRDLYETAALIAKTLGTTGQAVIANGGPASYADALAISSYAGYHGIPILFTERTALPAETLQALADQKVSQTLVVGGGYVVPEEIYRQLPGAVRYGGVDLYETATKLAEGLELNPSKVYVATGLNFADALTAGNLAARTLSPIVLVNEGIPSSTLNFLHNHQTQQSELIILGGEGIIRADQESALRSALTPSPEGTESIEGTVSTESPE
ncbi:cell wall-binding repeat-containing protein [Desulfosporosinus youngiae]|uniref:Cell wall-binding protein n=1 Tax=Desulfosporosinus youngiae DSM 17734 TaxID=768710 RepID=H5Y5S1_9FIRM|nr:cell wall-binding repeat-containing protein [Desulfosporosinus youngiae]EHQ90797.1 cell wall-binding protein [Desulfosporosinus youngiae DSM 17734]